MNIIKSTAGYSYAILSLLILMTIPASAEDWPTYNHDNQRSGISSEHFETPLYEQWRYQSIAPSPAWPEPALRDIWHKNPKLNPRVTYDRAYHVVSDGASIYFCSSSDDKIYSLDAVTGQVRWSYFTGGPNRLAPTLYKGRLYAGSDDGAVYCLSLTDGSLLWRFEPPLSSRKLPGNGRIISASPVRSGLVIEDGTLYFAAGLFPKEGTGIFALDPMNGEMLWNSSPENLSPQGYLLSSKERLYVPAGRIAPSAFDRNDGSLIGSYTSYHGEGGTYALITDDMLVSGPGKQLAAFSTTSGDQMLTFAGNRIIVTNESYYLLSDTELIAYDRSQLSETRTKRTALLSEQKALADSLNAIAKSTTSADGINSQNTVKRMKDRIERIKRTIGELKNSEHLWKTEVPAAVSMILSGDLLFCGGDGYIAACDINTGARKWGANTEGKTWGISVADGRLFASTDKGVIHCYTTKNTVSPENRISAIDSDIYPGKAESDMYAAAAREIVSKLDTDKGYCLVAGLNDGQLMYHLAQMTDFRIIGIDKNPENVRITRRLLDKAGLYGSRVSVMECTSDSLPLPDYCANLIVSESVMTGGAPPIAPDELLRVLRPDGGIVCLGSPAISDSDATRKVLEAWRKGNTTVNWESSGINGFWTSGKRRPLEGSGDWTHQYAEPGNSASSGDKLVKGPMHIQWFGRPGPRHINDRHHRPMAPLYKSGRAFVIGSNYVFGLDAYNGTILWEREIPGSRRVGVFRDCGQAAAAADYFYIAAHDKCLGIDAADGDISMEFTIPPVGDGIDRNWGYVAYSDDMLFGSAVKKTASRTTLSFETITGGTYFDNKPVVTSDYLFCNNRLSGDNKWIYRGGIIINSTLAVDDDAVYFAETTHPDAVNNTDGRILLSGALSKEHCHLVKLEKSTGKEIWRRAVGVPFENIFYLSLKDNVILTLGSYNKSDGAYYGLVGFNSESGFELWQNEYKFGDTINGDHGEQDQHPVIIGTTIYSKPCDFDLLTGKKGEFSFISGGHGCGTISGSAYYLFGRGNNPRMYNIADGGAKSDVLSQVNRPGCFINMIPAGGLILLPESSSGCVCAYPLQMSVAYAPAR